MHGWKKRKKKVPSPHPPNLLNLLTMNNLSRLYFPATMGILPWIRKRGKFSFIYTQSFFLLLLWLFVVF